MNKAILLVSMLIMVAFSGFGQRTEVSVCGIKMGTPKKTVMSILRERFGRLAVMEISDNLRVIKGNVGGVQHDFITFHFAWIKGISLLNGATFSTPYELYQKKDAICHRDLIKLIYEKKYELLEYINDDGFKSYLFGHNKTAYGEITVVKSEGEDGKVRFYTEIYYYSYFDESGDI